MATKTSCGEERPGLLAGRAAHAISVVFPISEVVSLLVSLGPVLISWRRLGRLPIILCHAIFAETYF